VTFSQTIRSSTLYDLELIPIKGSQFVMGSNDLNKNDFIIDRPQHKVILSSFNISKNEITYRQFKEFINSSNFITDAEKDGTALIWDLNNNKYSTKEGISWKNNEFGSLQLNENMPVVYISHNDAIAFCNWLSIKENKVYRLPTEAEWEYSAGGGNSDERTRFGNGKNFLEPSDANFNSFTKDKFSNKGNFPDRLTRVGTYNANQLGLNDMVGNVYEWVSDFFDRKYYQESEPTNPKGPISGTFKIIRGGSWLTPSSSCLITSRFYYGATASTCEIGFRVVLEK